MDPVHAAQWLLEQGGAVIRCRVASEFPEVGKQADSAALREGLLADAAVRQWLANLQPYETMLEAQQQGLGLGDGGHSSFLHGSTGRNIEVVLPKLGQLGVRAGLPALDEKAASWLRLLESGWQRGSEPAGSDAARFLSAVYFYYDHLLILASSLASAGYIAHPAVEQVLRSRLDAVYSFVRDGRYNIYEIPGSVRIHPKGWAGHVLRWDLVSDGNIRLPFIHDISGLIYLRQRADEETRQKIGMVIRWVLAPECQRFLYNYGYIRCPDGRGKSVGYKVDLPGYDGHDDPGFDPRALVLRCWQMAHFPEAREHPWFQKSMQHLARFTTADGTVAFPKAYLTEASERGYWIHGWRMGLGENRRSPRWSEIESTFWMLAIQQAAEHAGG